MLLRNHKGGCIWSFRLIQIINAVHVNCANVMQYGHLQIRTNYKMVRPFEFYLYCLNNIILCWSQIKYFNIHKMFIFKLEFDDNLIYSGLVYNDIEKKKIDKYSYSKKIVHSIKKSYLPLIKNTFYQ